MLASRTPASQHVIGTRPLYGTHYSETKTLLSTWRDIQRRTRPRATRPGKRRSRVQCQAHPERQRIRTAATETGALPATKRPCLLRSSGDNVNDDASANHACCNVRVLQTAAIHCSASSTSPSRLDPPQCAMRQSRSGTCRYSVRGTGTEPEWVW